MLLLNPPGRLYRALRGARGWSQERVAGELGVTQEYIGQIEREERPVPSEIPEEDEERKVGRSFLDGLLALGDQAEGEGEPVYVLGSLGPDPERELRLSDPRAAFARRDVADGLAALLFELGHRQVVVVPCWASVVGGETRDAAASDFARAWWGRNLPAPGEPVTPPRPSGP